MGHGSNKPAHVLFSEQVARVGSKPPVSARDPRRKDKLWPDLRDGCALALVGTMALLVDACDTTSAWTADLRVRA